MAQENQSLLEWPLYSEHLKIMMKEMLMDENFSDVTLVTEDKKQIKAHLNILSACSPFFKDILQKQNNSIIYLRGIHFDEVKSIIQFIYLGKTSFQQEMLDEVLSVARSLEITELSNAEPFSNDETATEPATYDLVTSGKDFVEESVKSEDTKIDAAEETNNQSDNHALNQGPSPFSIQSNLEGVRYACEQCDQQYTTKRNLTQHIQIKHEGVRYDCNHDQCSKQFTKISNLTEHINSVHEGKRFYCNQCDYHASRQSTVAVHTKSVHEGLIVMYDCHQCDKQFSQASYLT